MNEELKSKIDRLWRNINSLGVKNTAEALIVISGLVVLHQEEKETDIAFDEKEICETVSDYGSVSKEAAVQARINQMTNFFRDRPTEVGFLPMSEDAIEVFCRVFDSYQVNLIQDDICYVTKAVQKNAENGREICRYLLRAATSSGYLGQYSTPDYIARLMVRLMPPEENDIICDPSCGAGALLSAVWDFMCEKYSNPSPKQLFGTDVDNAMITLATANLLTHNADGINLYWEDALSSTGSSTVYDKIYINPPYNVTMPTDKLSPKLFGEYHSKKSELLFIALTLQLLRQGGQCACVVPNSLLYSSLPPNIALRRELVEENRLCAVISLPKRPFAPYANIEATILLYQKGQNADEPVWFYNMLEESDCEDVLTRYHRVKHEDDRTRDQKSFPVSVNELRAHEYILSPKIYREKVNCTMQDFSVEDVLEELSDLESKIIQKIDALRDRI